MQTLRGRLLGSYLLLLAFTIFTISIALLAFLGNRSEPDVSTYQDLTAVARGFLLSARRVNVINSDAIEDFAVAEDVRILVFDRSNGTVRYDSAGFFDIGDRISVQPDDNYEQPRTISWLPVQTSISYGSFTDTDGTRWLYAAFDNLLLRANLVFVLADLPSTRSLREILAEFGGALAGPVIQSAVIGLLVALLLAAVISRTLARPLQHFARAASAIAAGRFDHEVPVDGLYEFRTVAQALNTMAAEVRDTQQAQRDFLANVSHDLKTPLTSIQGYSQAIMDGTARDPAHAAGIIHDEAERLTRMVTELTELARLQSGTMTMKRVPIDFAEITQAIADRLQFVAAEKQIKLQTRIEAPLIILGDGDRMAQVITNLISNAIKYTPNGGRVAIIARMMQGMGHNGVEFSVRDNGIGIPAEELSRVFERFYQVDKARGPERGTGLGLAITREIVQAHQGTITVNSEGFGKGSTFTVWLPLHETSASSRITGTLRQTASGD